MMKLTTAKMLKLWTTQRPARMKSTRTRSRRTEKMTVVEWRPGSEKKLFNAKFVKLGNPRPLAASSCMWGPNKDLFL